MRGWITQQFTTTCFGLYRPSSGCTTSYILSYNYCNLDKVEYSGTDITSVSDDVLSEAGIIQK